MAIRIGSGLRRACTVLSIALSCSCLWGCLAATAQAKSQEVRVAPIAKAPGAAEPGMTHAELQRDFMRFADRYGGRMALVGDHLLAQAQTADERWLALRWKRAARVTVVAIAIGPDAVTNLLDMLVLASLTRLYAESYWVPEVIGAEKGKELLEAARISEKDIWSISDKVLPPGQQQELMVLIREWHEAQPDNYYFWDVRFGGFSGQRAARLERVAARGGLLGQVQQARETIDEFRALGERVLYYMQNAAALTRLQFTFGTYEMLRLPEMQQLLSNTHRFNASPAGCNWLVAADDSSPLCIACRLNRTLPDLSDTDNQRY